MKMRHLISFILFCFVIFPSQVRAQDEKQDARYQSITREYTLNADGSVDYRYVKEQKLLTYRAFHNLYGETFIVYNPACQKLKINEAFTVMADGKKIVAPENSFNEVLPGFANNAPAYNSLREMVITHTGLERNSTIKLDYQIHTEKGIFPALMGNELLAEAEPVKSLEFRVRIPAGQKLYYKLFNADFQPEMSRDGNVEVYTWKMNNMAAISVEESQPGANASYPRLVFSTSDNREKIYSFLTTQPAFRFLLTEPMKRAVSSLVAEKGDNFELAQKIQEQVVNDMRLYPIPLRVSLYQCRTPEETWNSNGGTVIEKAVLATALMKSAGLNATVVGIVRTAFSDDHIASLADIEDFAIQVEFKDQGTWYFSLTGVNANNLKYSLPGRSFVLLQPEKGFPLMKTETPQQKVVIQGNFIVSSDPKLTGEILLNLDGGVYPYASLLGDKRKLKNSISGGLIGSDTNNLKTSTLNVKNGFQTYIVQSDKPFRKDSNFYYFTLPSLLSGIESWGIRTLSEKRENAFEIPSVAEEKYTYTFILPTSLQLFTPAKKLVISNKAGSFEWNVTNEGGKTVVMRRVKFNERVYQQPNYQDFKSLMDHWNDPWYRQLIFTSENKQ